MVEAPVVAWPSRREGITRAFRSRFERLSFVRDETIAGSSGKLARGSRGGGGLDGGGLRMYAVFHCGEAPAFLFLPSFFDASVLKRSFETERPPTNRGVSQAPEVTHERR